MSKLFSNFTVMGLRLTITTSLLLNINGWTQSKQSIEILEFFNLAICTYQACVSTINKQSNMKRFICDPIQKIINMELFQMALSYNDCIIDFVILVLANCLVNCIIYCLSFDCIFFLCCFKKVSSRADLLLMIKVFILINASLYYSHPTFVKFYFLNSQAFTYTNKAHPNFESKLHNIHHFTFSNFLMILISPNRGWIALISW